MPNNFVRMMYPLLGLLLLAFVVHAGGVDPGDMPHQDPVISEKSVATPAQTAAAVNKVRRAVTPAVKQVSPTPRTKAVASTSKDSWLLGSSEGKCASLTSVSRKVKNIGSFRTPQEFAHQMQQRGYQAFALDIGDMPDQVVRVKVPDLDLDLTFVKAGMCR